MRKLVAYISGLLFGGGLIVSDMVNPARVRAFLDIFGDWDPSLAFVMVGAIAVTAFAWRIVARRERALFGGSLPADPSDVIDRRLVGGAALFGIGWGAVGICPAPGIVALSFGLWQVIVFMSATLIGMGLYHLWNVISVKGLRNVSQA